MIDVLDTIEKNKTNMAIIIFQSPKSNHELEILNLDAHDLLSYVQLLKFAVILTSFCTYMTRVYVWMELNIAVTFIRELSVQ